MDVKLLRAFIASPGGLETERRAAFAAAAEVNKSVAQPLGARLELLGWEETLSGSGRPQAIINSEMETCDLFIGLMWTKWGSQPSLDGPYSSGFEEEFELSRERHGRTSAPLMAMFFKDIDVLQLGDPGDELRKVLAFQEKLKSEKLFLYDTFSDADAFAAKVRIFLSTHVIRLVNQASRNDDTLQSRTAASSTELAETQVEAEGPPEQSDATHEEAKFLHCVATDLKRDDNLSERDVARLRLIAASVKTNVNDPLIIGAHDANILYRERAVIELSNREKRELLISGLANQPHQNVPLWTWLGALDRNQPALLLALTIFGEDAVRVGALNVMRLLQKPISGQKLIKSDMLLRSWLNKDCINSVKLAALSYLRDMGTQDALAFIDVEIARSNKDTRDAALSAYLSILLRYSPRDAVDRLLKSHFESLQNEILDNVLNYADDLSTEELRPGLDHRSAGVRAKTISILTRRLALSIDTLKRACDDDAAIVRLAAIEAFDEIGQSFSLDETYNILGRSRKPSLYLLIDERDSIGDALFEIYRERRLLAIPASSLRALLSSNQHTHAAYRILAARQIDDFASKLRADIKDGFTSYFSRHWPEGIKPAPTTALGALRLGDTDPNNLKRRELIKAALDTVAARRDESDIDLIRHALDANSMAPSEKIIGYLSAVGDRTDIQRLARTLRFSWPSMILVNGYDEFKLAAKAILKFSKGCLKDTIFSDIPDAMRIQILEIASWPDLARFSDEDILKLLLSDSELLKRAAARKFSAALTRRRINKILRLYRASEGGIYYIIVHWLDLGLGLPQKVARLVVSRSE